MVGASGQEWWRRVDWIDVFGNLVADLSGPFGAPIKALINVREDLKEPINSALNVAVQSSEDRRPNLTQVNVLGHIATSDQPALSHLVELARAAVFSPDVDSPEALRADLAARISAADRTIAENFRYLRKALAYYFNDPDEVRLLLSDAGIQIEKVNLRGSSDIVWASVGRYLEGNDPRLRLRLLLEAQAAKPNADEFRKALGLYVPLD